jgi:hypothetical protein
MDSDRLRQLLSDLRDFRLRREACDEIIAMGSDAGAPLLEALKTETHEGARWAIMNCLGRLRCVPAVAVLAQHVEDPNYGTAAHEALVSIAGRDLGPMSSEWLRWAERYAVDQESGESSGDTAPDARLSCAQLVQRALSDGVASCAEESADRFTVNLPLAEGRRQQVAVIFGSTDHEREEIVIVYSDCGPARPEHYETALRRNLRMPYGAVALRDRDGEPRFVMFNTILRHGLTPVELRKSIMSVGELADRFQRQLED